MVFFFFKQKTAYEMRISDWSSDVCSSDLMFEAAGIVGSAIREVARRDGEGLKQQGLEPSLSMLLGGQIAGRPHALYMLYYAGNFIRATEATPFLQIGEIKYGKPILEIGRAHV